MIKGKIYYNNKNIKYIVKMNKLFENIYVVIETKLNWYSFYTKRTIDSSIYDIDDNGYKESEIQRNEFLNEWNSYSSKEIKDIAEKCIMAKIDNDKKIYDKNWKVNKLVNDFNYKGCYYENIPKCPIKIPMPEIKPCKTTNIFDNVKVKNDKDIEFKLGDKVIVNNSIKGKIEAIDDKATNFYCTHYFIRYGLEYSDKIIATSDNMKLI